MNMIFPKMSSLAIYFELVIIEMKGIFPVFERVPVGLKVVECSTRPKALSSQSW